MVGRLQNDMGYGIFMNETRRYLRSRSEAHCDSAWAFVFSGKEKQTVKQTYLVYLDEFGHVGPYISRTHDRFKECPIFGFGGILVPTDQIRNFSTWFYQLKCRLLEWEIAQSKTPSFRWEKKGSSLYTTTNVLKYPELRKATFRLLNKIKNVGGKVFYVGIEKTADPKQHRPNSMTLAVLRESIKRLDEFCLEKDSGFLIFLDARDDPLLREAVVQATQTEMFGINPRRTLLETPTQVESHLYQLMQCADWLCGLIARVETYRTCPEEFPDFDWAEKYFSNRLAQTAVRSGVRKQSNFT